MNYEETLLQLSSANERIIVMTAENRAAIRNLPKLLGNRFVDVGIAEQTLVGMAAGLALRGRIPVIHSLAAFLTMRAFEFIRTDVGISNLPVKLVGAVPGFLSEANGPTHQAVEDISLMKAIPNMKIFCPADEEDMLLGLPEIISDPHPYYIRYNSTPPAIEHDKDFRIGKAEVISQGSDITILTYGLLLKQAILTSMALKLKGFSVGVINLRTLKPFDYITIDSVCSESRILVTLEDHFITGGLYSILSEYITSKHLRKKVIPIALQDRWFKPALLTDVLEYEGFTPDAISVRIINEFEKLEPLVAQYYY